MVDAQSQDGIAVTRSISAAAMPQQKQPIVSPPSFANSTSGNSTSQTQNSTQPPRKSAAGAKLPTTSSKPNAQPPSTATVDTVFPDSEAAPAAGAAHGAVSKAATANQTQHSALNLDKTPTAKLANVSGAYEVSRTPASGVSLRIENVAPSDVAVVRDKDFPEPSPGLPQPPSATTATREQRPEEAQTTDLQGTPPVAPLKARAQDTTEEQTNSIAPTNPVAGVPKAQQPEADQSPAQSEAPVRLPHATGEPAPVEATSGGVVAARIVEEIGRSEMHIGLRTQAFGTVDVHTALRDTQLGLAVSSERGDLRSFLAPDVPALQTVIRQHDLRFDKIQFTQPSGANTTFSDNANSQSRYFSQSTPSASALPPDDTTEPDAAAQEISLQTPVRLSVHV
jgi:hypothetical protein